MKFDVDIEVESGYFNTSASNLWTKVQRVFYNELRQQYKLMRQDRYTEENIMSYLYGNQISKIPQKFYNFDMQTKYLDFGPSYLYACHGNRHQHMKRWVRERLIFMDTLFEYFASTNDFVTVRANKLGYVYMDLQVYSPMYLTVKWRNQGNQTDEEESRKNKAGYEYRKVNRGETVRFSATLPTATDQEILIYGGRFLKDLGDLSNLQPSTLLISPAVNLTKITCHSPNLTTTDFSTCTKLQEIDLSDCVKLGSGIGTSSTLNIASCTNLRRVNAFNTQLTAILTNLSGGNIEEIRYPYSVQTITVKNQPLLRSLGIPIYYTGNLTDSNNQFVERLVSVDIANCERLDSLVTNYYEENSEPVEVPAFLGVKYGQTFSISNSLTSLERLDLSHCANLRSLSLGDFTKLKELNIDDITAWDATSSNLSQLTLTNCPNVEVVTFNQNTINSEQSLGVAFKEGTVIDLSGLTKLKHVRSNVGVKGLKTLILPLSVVSLVFDFPKDTTYSQPYSDIENIWSYTSNHTEDGFKGIDLLDMNTITDFSMGSLNLIERAENLNLKITNTFPYFNYHKTSNFFQPTGQIDISDYTDELAHLFKGVDLDKLKIICTKPLTQQNASYMFSYASCSDTETIPQLFTFLTNTTDLSYMFYHASILHAPSLPNTTTDCRYMFYNCSSMISTPSNWNNDYLKTPISNYCYKGCTGIERIDEETGTLDNIPAKWGGYERQNITYGGEKIVAENTLERELTTFKAKGSTLQNIVPTVAQTPTLMSQTTSQSLRKGLSETILTTDGEMPKAELEGITLVNLASERRSGVQTTNQSFTDIHNGLDESFIINHETPLSNLTLEGLTLVNILPKNGKTPLISNNESSYQVNKGLDEKIILDNHKMLSCTLYGETIKNNIDENNNKTPLIVLDEGKTKNSIAAIASELHEQYDKNIKIQNEASFKRAILKGNTLVNLSPFKSLMDVTPSVLNENSVIWFGSVSEEYFNYSMFKPNTKYIVKFGLGTPSRFKGTYIGGLNMPNKNGYHTEHNDVFTTPQTIPTKCNLYLNGIDGDVITKEEYSKIEVMIIEYQEGMENWDIPYFDGMRSVKMPVLTTTGKNLFNGSIIENSVTKIEVFENIECISTLPMNNLNSIVEFGQPIKLDDAIVISFVAKNSNSYLKIRPIFEDDTLGSEIGSWVGFSDWTKLSFIVPSNSKKIKGFTCMSSSAGAKVYIQKETVQIEYGSTPSSYEPYKSNILTTSEEVELRGIGDVKDELNLITGELTQRVGTLYLANEYEGIDFDLSKGSTVFISLGVKDDEIIQFSPILSNTFETKDVFNLDEEGILYDGWGLYARVLKSRITELTNDSIVQYLKAIQSMVFYRKKVESIKTVDLSYVNTVGEVIDRINVFNEGAIAISSDTINPTLECQLPTTNYFEFEYLQSETNYTLRFEGEATSATLGGTVIPSTNDSLVTTNATDNVLYLDGEVSNVMLLEGDYVGRDIPYFTGMRSVEAIEIATMPNPDQPLFGKGGRL